MTIALLEYVRGKNQLGKEVITPILLFGMMIHTIDFAMIINEWALNPVGGERVIK